MTIESTTSMASPLVLRRLSPGDDLGGALGLMAGYVDEIRRNLLRGYGLDLEDATPDSGLLVEIGGLLEPPQCLYLVEVHGQPAGTGGLKQIAPDAAEIKRMYVDPAFRRQGIGRMILQRLIADGRAAGYQTLRLETAVWMVEAHGLYRRCGFVNAPPLANPEFGCFPDYEPLARYMSLALEAS